MGDPCGGPHMRTARGRRRIWRAARRAAEQPRYDETRQRNASTLHLVIHLPGNATATTAAAIAAGSACSSLLTTVVEKTTTADLKLKEIVNKDELLIRDINLNDFSDTHRITKIKKRNEPAQLAHPWLTNVPVKKRLKHLPTTVFTVLGSLESSSVSFLTSWYICHDPHSRFRCLLSRCGRTQSRR